MEHTAGEHVKYKGYTIFPMPALSAGALWLGGYEITKDGTPVSVRKNIFPGFFYSEAAWNDSIGHAKIEIDNLAM
ncbi:hypothetical protein [Noviherbaspirillum autotrophicum]|uniref:Uncharacterized protein n=1 Tax=Noviherbaspirillum autotrophicum TaxID=709839 RepID=A0A0C1YHG9_9BURK|nr:hypothetical protein [Noviherbaspirillum autotrophicum]KIF79912.1 hypothetical protein TSA66_02200 [Noviherbaspirillum autotrophicum]